MMSEAPAKTPWHLWGVGLLATLFNAVGPFDFIMVQTRGASYMTAAGMTTDQVDYYLGMPTWMTIVWAVGVFAALSASILLLMRRKIAAPLFWIGLGAFLLNLLPMYLRSDVRAAIGMQMLVTNIVIAVLLILFALYARAMAGKGVLG